jgi:hypothetical protein
MEQVGQKLRILILENVIRDQLELKLQDFLLEGEPHQRQLIVKHGMDQVGQKLEI